jgi:phage repressor protein C with HTH and peptisase S24 domain
MEQTTESPGELIKQEREKRGWSQETLAEKAGISQEALWKIENGRTRQSKFLPKIAELLELPLPRLDRSLTATETSPPAPPLAAAPSYGRRDFPVHGSAEGGPGQIIVSTDPVDYIERPAQLAQARDAYGLLITGTSMEPEYRPGDTALVHRHLPIIPDEVYVFYADHEGEVRATIKHLRRATQDKWLVTQHNPPEGGSKDFTLLRREWQNAHRVIGRYRPR